MPLDDEKKIIDMLRSDNEQENDQGFKFLYQQFFPMISQFIMRNSGKLEDVEDLFQDGILVLYNQIKRDELVLTCKLRTYFHSICRNLWLNELKQKKRVIEDIQDHESFILIEPSVFKSIEINEEKEVMFNLVSQMGEGCQKIPTLLLL